VDGGQPESYQLPRRVIIDKRPCSDWFGQLPGGLHGGNRQPMASHAAYAASRISSNLKGSTKQFGWLPASTTNDFRSLRGSKMVLDIC
jgi:hypothetical protein